MVLTRTALVFSVVLVLAGAGPTRAERYTCKGQLKRAYPEVRRALVIGNASYKKHEKHERREAPSALRSHFADVRAALDDARGMADALCALGFEVSAYLDADKTEIEQALKLFHADSKDAEVRLFYYSGHGVELKDENYLVPIGTDSTSLASEVVSFRSLYESLTQENDREGREALKIFLFDACRAVDSAIKPKKEQGLALPAWAPDDTIFGFATAPRRTAKAPKKGRSYYTEALLQSIRNPGLPIAEFFNAVRRDVWKATYQEQLSWESTASFRNVYFEPPPRIEWSIDYADDAVVVLVNDVAVVADADLRAPRPGGARQVPVSILRSGDNDFRIMVYNQKTSSPGLVPKREGWEYIVKVRVGNGEPREFADKRTDDVPYAEWGNIFVARTGRIHVDPNDGSVTIHDGGKPTSVIPVACEPDTNVNLQMEWCANDKGFNEGAACGRDAIGGLNLPLPRDAEEAVLGNVWKRSEMMVAAREAFRNGHHEEAVTAAICCQIHSPGYPKLRACRKEVAAWLSR